MSEHYAPNGPMRAHTHRARQYAMGVRSRVRVRARAGMPVCVRLSERVRALDDEDCPARAVR